MDDAAFHPWMKDFCTARFQEDKVTQCFSEVMVKLLLAAKAPTDDAAFHPWMKDFHTSRSLQEWATQCFSEVMVKLLLAALILMGNAAFHPWKKEFHTPRSLQEVATQCFSEVMVKPLLAALILIDNATFHPGMKGFHTPVSAGGSHTVLLRSDGQAVACGRNTFGQCNIPSLTSWREWLPFGFASPSYRYVCESTTFAMLGRDRVVQVDFLLEGDGGVILTCAGLDGLEVLRLKAQTSDRTVDVCSRVARELNTTVQNLRMVLPDARLLTAISKANPSATLSDVISA